ncbi:MAG TPA: glutamate-5-semialdehyde dehydrogenase [Anaerolineales bacterium]|nr:glutamate-5-semialdehyde dehydrogenase [Anaerolineales bacterium]
MGLEEMGRKAKEAFRVIAKTSGGRRRTAVECLADELESRLLSVRKANEQDIQLARESGLSEALIDRLTLTDGRLSGLIADVRALADLPDPVGSSFDERVLPNGLKVSRRRVPLGVLGVIYESRPNVTIDVAALAIKTGNAVILRGGKETIHSNRALVSVCHSALNKSGLPEAVVQFIDSPDRELVGQMLRLNDYIDVIVPRGGNSLHQFCRANATIPVMTGGIGICHLYVDSNADLEAALPVIHNAKTQRPSVCNALDTLLVNEAVAAGFLPRVVEHLAASGVTFRADQRAAALVEHPSVQEAGPDDFDQEWLSLVLGLKVVPDLDAAIDHINHHSTWHSDGILTETPEHAARFLDEVDSAAVYVNASTRFTDGAQLGLGAEVAVSTQRLHARGPMGLTELTTYKWVIEGDYTVRE